MSLAQRLLAVVILLPVIFLFSDCGSSSTQTTVTGPGSGGGPATGSGTNKSVPGYGEGIGASGQTGPAKFLYANPLPGNGPYTATISASGTLTLGQSGSANNVNPMTMAIDPAGSFLYQVAQGYSGGTQGGLFVYAINRTDGTLGTAMGTYLAGQALNADVVDNLGKFLYVLGSSGVYAFSIQSGVLTPVAGSPFPTAGPSTPGYSQPATLMVVDQTNKFLYVSTSGGIEAFSIDPKSGQLTPVAGSPFGSNVQSPWTEVITPNNSFLYVLSLKDASGLFGFSVDHASGALTPLPGSPFSTGTCGTVTPSGAFSVPASDNMTIASAGKFMYDNCGVYSLDHATGAVAQVSGQGPGDWPVIDPTGKYLWAITSDQTACFHCDVGLQAYSVDASTGAFTAVPNGFLLVTNTMVGDINSLAITK